MQLFKQLNSPTLILLASGAILGLIFAPYYFLPGVFSLSVLGCYIKDSASYLQACKRCYVFGYGFFLVSLYWISYGPAQFEEFTWVVPIALFLIPAFMALLIVIFMPIAWFTRHSSWYKLIFCCCLLAYELLSNYLFTGFPWALIGYSLAISPILMQFAYYIKVFGLSFILAIIGVSFCNFSWRWTFLSLVLFVVVVSFGYVRLLQNPTKFSDKTILIVQPSIKQTEKWQPQKFWQNLQLQLKLSQATEAAPDIILWSESALTAPYYLKPIKEALFSVVNDTDSVLITGNILEDGEKVYPAMIAINQNGIVDSYYKAHLVPFGEYIPFKNTYLGRVLNLRKITDGFKDFSQGRPRQIELKSKGLKIRPLICYEVIFPFEAAMATSSDTDLLINITNDAWYGLSSGPYQHFAISKFRAVETGLPMVRAANNGISAVIDPLGRVVKELPLNKSSAIKSLLPIKFKP